MCKFRLALTGLSALFINLLISAAAFAAPPTLPPAITLPVLTPDQFKQTVGQLNAQTQSGLDAALYKLLGTTPQPMGSTSAMPATTPQSSPQATTPSSAPEENSTIATPPPASSGSGLNPYAN